MEGIGMHIYSARKRMGRPPEKGKKGKGMDGEQVERLDDDFFLELLVVVVLVVVGDLGKVLQINTSRA